MNETTFRQTLCGAFRDVGGAAQPVENAVALGCPDMVWALGGITGWAELKVINALPKRADTKITIRHFTNEQARFLVDWHQGEGAALLVIWVAPGDVLVFTPRQALAVYLGVRKAELYIRASWQGPLTQAPHAMRKVAGNNLWSRWPVLQKRSEQLVRPVLRGEP